MSKSYYNYSLLEEDNCFINRFYELLSEKLNGWLEDKISYRLTKTDLKENCSFILKIQTDDDYEEWKPLRCVESRQMLSDMIADAFENFTYWLNCDVKQDELINLFFDIFADKIEREIEMYFPDGIK